MARFQDAVRRFQRRREPSRTRGPKPAEKDWAILVYIGGDNNLSNAGLEDIDEMCEVGADESLYVGVEIDTYGELTGSIRYEITPPDWQGYGRRVVIERLPEQDHGDPRVFADFVAWGIERFPAKNRLLVVWNHGSGFRMPNRDIAYDDFGSSLDMPEVEHALDMAGVGGKAGKLSIMGFDACLMNMLEVVHHFSDQVDFIVGSQQTEPGDGWPYERLLSNAKGAPDPVALADAIVKEYIQDYTERGVDDVTQSAIDLSKTEPIVGTLHDLGKSLTQYLPAQRDTIALARMDTQIFQYADYADAIDLANRIETRMQDAAVNEVTHRLVELVKAAVVAEGKYGSSVKNANGLSVWFPMDAQTYFANRGKYLSLRANRERQDWVRFLDTYFA